MVLLNASSVWGVASDDASTLAHYAYASGLAISSSTDNFAVGASLGLSGLTVSIQFNLVIASANAFGAFVAAAGGNKIGELAEGAGSWLACAVFLYLAWQEGASLWDGEDASPLLRLASEGVAMRLAVPMTLNNIAGGVAGGVVGISPQLASITAFFASFLMMLVGYISGRHMHAALRSQRIDVRLLSCSTFGILAYMQAGNHLQELWENYLPFRFPLAPVHADTLLACISAGGLLLFALIDRQWRQRRQQNVTKHAELAGEASHGMSHRDR